MDEHRLVVTERELLIEYLPHWTYDSFEFHSYQDSTWCLTKRIWRGLEIQTTVTLPALPFASEAPRPVDFLFTAPRLRVSGWARRGDHWESRPLKTLLPSKANFSKALIPGKEWNYITVPSIDLATNVSELAIEVVQELQQLGMRW